MASPVSSASEGEIFDTTKANTASSQSPEPTIDNPHRAFGLDGSSYDDHRRGRRNLSRSPSPYRHKVDRSPPPYRHSRDENRSPSPFRHGRDHRGRDDKHSYSYKRKASPQRYSRPEKRYYSERERQRDRQHGSGHDDHYARGGDSRSYRGRENGNNRDYNRRPSYDDNQHSPSSSRFEDVSPKAKSGGTVKSNGRHGEPAATSSTKKEEAAQSAGSCESTGQQDVAMGGEAQDDSEILAPPAQDEAPSLETREEKRRRWAAKRAQHAAESSKLLQQAVLANASETTTPNIGSPAGMSVSPPPASPGLSDFGSGPGSPDVMVIDKQDTMGANANQPNGGPSAADYDPVQDMLEDRARAEQRLQQTEMSASAYEETDPKVLSTLPAQKANPANPAHASPPIKKKKQKEIDMFASSDEDDVDEDDGEEENSAGNFLAANLLDNWDDSDGYYKLQGKELVNAGRYRVIKNLGRGVFASVVQAEDMTSESRALVAIKIVRRNDAMRKASSKEMDFLQRLNDADPQDKRHIIRLLGSFDHKGHLCIVFEHMSKNLRDLLKEDTSGNGLSLQAVKTYARQMFSGLKHLQDCQIIHADLKPDNILVSLDKKTIKLCDLGTAADKRDNNEPTPYLVSRFYRAPEIILGMEIGYGIDVWAIGCTIYELWTGKILFPGNSNNQMVKAFMECMGWPSEKLLRKGQLSGQHFDPGPPLKLISREIDPVFGKPVIRAVEQHRMKSRPLKDRVSEASLGIATNRPSALELNDFTDLLAACLNWNFEKRIQPKEALTHKFFVNKALTPRSTVVKPFPKRGSFFGGKK